MPLLRRTSLSSLPLQLTRRRYSSQNIPVTIGIRCEDPARVWERRAPLTPDVVAELVEKDGVKVLVQECERRVFPLDEYIRVCARIFYHHDECLTICVTAAETTIIPAHH